ncbi:hypothetical protein HY024_01960 [Candidatus Curtissbacteria bacterium]|nr:hypothetical protein [Candidatus Curtissbacteria bacterium]
MPTITTNSWEMTMAGDPLDPKAIAAELPPFVLKNYGTAHGLWLKVYEDDKRLASGGEPVETVRFRRPPYYTCDFEHPNTRDLVTRRAAQRGELDLIIDPESPRVVGIPAGRAIFIIAKVKRQAEITLEEIAASTYLDEDPPVLRVEDNTVERVLASLPAFLAEHFPSTQNVPINIYDRAYGNQMLAAAPYAKLKLENGLLVYQPKPE